MPKKRDAAAVCLPKASVPRALFRAFPLVGRFFHRRQFMPLHREANRLVPALLTHIKLHRIRWW